MPLQRTYNYKIKLEKPIDIGYGALWNQSLEEL